MKVYSNKYRNHWISPYTMLEKALFWLDWDNISYSTPWVEKTSNILEPLSYTIQWVLDKVHPKIDYIKIDSWDTWNADYTLAKIAVPLLKQLKEEKHGIPSEFLVERDTEMSSGWGHEQLELFDDDLDWYNGESVRQWDMAMDHMIWALEQVVLHGDGGDEPYWVPMTEEEIAEEKRTSQFKWTIKKKIDVVKMEQYERDVQEGLELFGRHFRSLWD